MSRLRARALAARGLEVEPGHRLRRDRDRGRAARDRRLHARLRRDASSTTWTARRAEFNWLLHFVLPIGGIVLFFLPLYYQFLELPPPYPFKYGNWYAGIWAAAGVLITAFFVLRRDRSGSPTSTGSTSRTTPSRSWWRSGGRHRAPHRPRPGDLGVRPGPRARARGRARRDGHLRDERLLHGPDPVRGRPRHRDRPRRGSTARPGRWR